MGTDEQSKKLFGMSVSKEFAVAICSLIFAAGANYMKLTNIDSSVGSLEKTLDKEQENFAAINLAEKLLENRVLALEQKTQAQQQQHK